MAKGLTAGQTSSVKAASNRLRVFLKKLKTVPIEVLREEAQQMKAEVIAEVPYRTGALESSVQVRVSKERSKVHLRASASAQNVDTGYNYAGIQHENDLYGHEKGKDHYISDPYNRAIKRIEQRMREELKVK